MARQLSTHTLSVVIAPEEGAWHAFCPALLDYGAATWAATREEALAHLREMLTMLLERLAERRVLLPLVAAEPAAAHTEQVVITLYAPTGR